VSEVRLRFNGKEAQEQHESSDGDGNANYDPLLLDKKVTMATEGLEPFFTKILRQKTSKENALDIAEYINTLKREINISLGYKRINIQTLVDLSKFHLNRKNFKVMTKEDILQYLESPQTGSLRFST
jgi:hypothetical protein